MKLGICLVGSLKDLIVFSPKEEKKLKQIIKKHPMRVTPKFVSLINWDDPDDPMRKMAIPSMTKTWNKNT